MRIKFFWPAAILLLIFGSCNKTDQATYTPASVKEMKIGVLLPLTGSGFSSGESLEASLELAGQDIRDYFATTGIKRTLILEIADTRTDTAEALKQLRTFYGSGIRTVIGPYSSAELSHIRTFADSHGMLIISPSSVAVSLAIPGDNIYRFVSSDVLQGKAMGKMLVEDKEKIVVPVIRNDVWGNDLLQATSDDFTGNGGQMEAPVRYDPGNVDFTIPLTQLDGIIGGLIQHHNPNDIAVYMLSFAEGAKMLASAKSYPNLNMVYWYGGSAFAQNSAAIADTNSALFAYTHGLACPIFGLDQNAAGNWEPLKERIIAQINRVPDVYAFTGYDALWVLVLARLAVDDQADIDILKKSLEFQAGKYYGVTGNTSLDENGDRASANYDFWSVKQDSAGYCWKLTAQYNSLNNVLTRIKP